MAASTAAAATAATASAASSSAATQRRRYGCIAADARIPSGRHFFQCCASPPALLRALAHVVQALDDPPHLLLHIPIERRLEPHRQRAHVARALRRRPDRLVHLLLLGNTSAERHVFQAIASLGAPLLVALLLLPLLPRLLQGDVRRAPVPQSQSSASATGALALVLVSVLVLG